MNLTKQMYVAHWKMFFNFTSNSGNIIEQKMSGPLSKKKRPLLLLHCSLNSSRFIKTSSLDMTDFLRGSVIFLQSEFCSSSHLRKTMYPPHSLWAAEDYIVPFSNWWLMEALVTQWSVCRLPGVTCITCIYVFVPESVSTCFICYSNNIPWCHMKLKLYHKIYCCGTEVVHSLKTPIQMKTENSPNNSLILSPEDCTLHPSAWLWLLSGGRSVFCPCWNHRSLMRLSMR